MPVTTVEAFAQTTRQHTHCTGGLDSLVVSLLHDGIWAVQVYLQQANYNADGVHQPEVVSEKTCMRSVRSK